MRVEICDSALTFKFEVTWWVKDKYLFQFRHVLFLNLMFMKA